MKKAHSSFALAALSLVACNGQIETVLVPDPAAGTGLVTGADPAAPQLQTTGKVDLLLAVDDSSSMKPKQKLLAQSAGRLVQRLTTPLCLDGAGHARGSSTLDPRGEAICPAGTALEFAAVCDLHVGVLSSSLGNGGNADGNGACSDENGHHSSDHAQLVTRGIEGLPHEGAGFLAYGATAGAKAYSDPAALAATLETLVEGVGDQGCGLENQLESLYQFLVAPDPWADVSVDENGRASYSGLNGDTLRQRHDFLRPDSMVAVVLVTDEDDSSLDPLSVGRTGYYFSSSNFPGGNARFDGRPPPLAALRRARRIRRVQPAPAARSSLRRPTPTARAAPITRATTTTSTCASST